MMQYADEDYYRNNYHGDFSGGAVELNKLLTIASRKIDRITFNRIYAYGFENLTDFQQELVKNAVCHQADHYAKNGLSDFSGLSGFSVGDIKMSFSGMPQAALSGFSETGYSLLEQTGLLWRGV